ncbi:hypothetical protein NMY22_g12144 [Coprinellus aureogranulatus]|nr:hypothetical protein NMY22_g12144 [Coprinellus aureogranulatus]
MSVAVLAPQPIVPVIDERLHFPSDATKPHKDKINSYNDLLEEVFQRELELARLKASLVDMKVEIVEEAQTLDTTGQVISAESLKAGEADVESSESGEEAESDSAASGEDAAAKKDGSGKKKRRGSKGKSKGKGRVAMRAEERGANWDYNLNVAGGNRRARVADEDDHE